CFSRNAESETTAVARLPSFKPLANDGIVETSFAKWPSTKTRRGPLRSAKVNLPGAFAATPSVFAPNTGLNGSFASGATFVKRQSSSFSVGKPSSAKRAMPALRSGKSHEGCLPAVGAMSSSNFARYGSVSFMVSIDLVAIMLRSTSFVAQASVPPVRRLRTGTPAEPARRKRALRRLSFVAHQTLVTSLFEFQGQLFAVGLDDASIEQHVHEIWNDVVEQSLIVRDDELRVVRALQLVHAFRHHFQRVDVEARIGFVKDG